MQAEYINPFIRSLRNTFQTMLACEAHRGQLSVGLGAPTDGVSGVIGLSGKARGTVVLNMSPQVALKAASVMLAEDVTEVNADVLDAVGELTNIIAGNAKAQLEQYDLRVSLPNVVTGNDHRLHLPSDVTPLCVPFDCPWGPISLVVGLAVVQEPVHTG